MSLFSIPKYKSVFLPPSVQSCLPLTSGFSYQNSGHVCRPDSWPRFPWVGTSLRRELGEGPLEMSVKAQLFDPPPLEVPKTIFIFFSLETSPLSVMAGTNLVLELICHCSLDAVLGEYSGGQRIQKPYPFLDEYAFRAQTPISPVD